MGRQEQTNHLFSNRDLRILLVPLIVEQILNSLMGTADSIMVSNVGSFPALQPDDQPVGGNCPGGRGERSHGRCDGPEVRRYGCGDERAV